MSTFTDLEKDAASVDGFVNENGLIPTRRNGPKPSYQYLVDGWTAEIDATIIELNKSRGFRVVGKFADGFKYELFNDVGIDADGNSWIYVGAGAPNKVVPAGTVPSVGDGYEQVTFNAASGVINANGGSVQDFIDASKAQGIMPWDVNTTYPVNGLAKGSDGNVYLSAVEQSGNDPTSDSGTNWILKDRSFVVENVSKMKSNNYKIGDLITTSSYYENPKGYGGASYIVLSYSEYYDLMGRVPDEYGDITLDNGNIAKVKVGSSINVEQFGAVADGVLSDGSVNPNPTDNADAFQAACNYLTRGTYPEYQGGKLEFRGGVHVCYATSGGTQLPECKIIGNQCKIRPLNAPNYIFNLNLLHTTNTRRFTKNWLFEGFTMWTDRGFGVNFSGVDCDHLLKITGGWLIRSKIQNIDVDPGFACRSLVLWDLSHPDVGNVKEIGVPDGIVFDSISAQYAENTSFAISFLGDQLGTGSRLGSTTFRDIYNSITYPHDYTTRGQAFNDFGVLRIDNVDFGRAKIEELYGAQPIIMFNDSKFTNSYFRYLYVEFNRKRVSDFESILRGGKYVNCDFEYVNMYTENENLSAPPRFFFTTFEQCRFGRISAFVQSQLTNAPDANFINLGANSFGNTIEAKPLISNQPDDPGMGWLLKRISAPVDTQFKFLDPKTIARKVTQIISADGEYLLGSVPSDLTEITAFVKAKLAVHKITQVNANVALKFAGAGLGNTATGPTATLTNASGLDARLIGEFIGRSDQVTDPSPTQFSTRAVYSFEVTGEPSTSSASGLDDLLIQFRSGDYEVYLVVSNLSGGDIEVANFELEYGHSNEYVNMI